MIVSGAAELRNALPPPPDLIALCQKAIAQEMAGPGEARQFFEQNFQPYRITGPGPSGPAFLTGYYEPVVAGSLTRTEDFTEPLFARPDDLVRIAPYPVRAEIEAMGMARYRPVVWLRDAIEVFMIQVQGSAAVDLPDGQRIRLTYAGRNGRPYTSIGRILMASGEIPEAEMSLARLKQWVRDHGQDPGEPGRALLHRNESYIFFAVDGSDGRSRGPIGGAGVPLTPLRSVAVDRTVWPYGLPVWIDAQLPDAAGTLAPFRRLMIGQDTGSAIVGPARLDLFMGSGDAAGAAAGNIRHGAVLYILLPRPDESQR
jgi:membrane-bound lytic murein transglycosylase A